MESFEQELRGGLQKERASIGCSRQQAIGNDPYTTDKRGIGHCWSSGGDQPASKCRRTRQRVESMAKDPVWTEHLASKAPTIAVSSLFQRVSKERSRLDRG